MKKQIQKSDNKVFTIDINKNLNLLIVLKINNNNRIQ